VPKKMNHSRGRQIPTKPAMKPMPAAAAVPRYRYLVRIPLALKTEASQPFALTDEQYPILALRSVDATEPERMVRGETYAALEFLEPHETDLIRLVAIADGRMKDALAVTSLVTGIPIVDYAAVQFLETTPRVTTTQVVYFFSTYSRSWRNPVKDADVANIRKIFRHWSKLDLGYRLRRAGHYYSNALSKSDPIDAFLTAWSGLEALEKPLAAEFGCEAGTEITKGQCTNCGFEYERRRTMIVAVKRFVLGEIHGESPERRSEWKNMHELRNDLSHGLEDPGKVEAQARDLLPAALHYLHDASVHLAHEHSLELSRYELKTTNDRVWLLAGTVQSGEPGPLEQWAPDIDVSDFSWDAHPEFGYVPRFLLHKTGKGEVSVECLGLTKPLSVATREDVVRLQIEKLSAD